MKVIVSPALRDKLREAILFCGMIWNTEIAEPVPNEVRNLILIRSRQFTLLSEYGSEFASAKPRNRFAPRNDQEQALLRIHQYWKS